MPRPSLTCARKPGHWAILGALLLSGLAAAAGCSGADSVSPVDFSCKPTLCVAPDPTDDPIDGVAFCPTGVCNYQAQTGCQPNETCAAQVVPGTATIAPTCVATGNVKRGDSCDDTRLCAPGLQCVGPKGSPRVCRKLCCAAPDKPYGDWTACDPGESCVRQLQAKIEQPPGSKTFITIDANVDFCVPVNNCNVLDRNSCIVDGGAGDKIRPVCRIADPVGNVACQPPGSADLGESCQRFDQCNAVEICAKRESAGVVVTDLACRRLCRLTSCAEGEACPREEGTCVHFKRDPEGIGECTPNFNTAKYCKDLNGAPLPTPDAGKHHDAAIDVIGD